LQPCPERFDIAAIFEPYEKPWTGGNMPPVQGFRCQAFLIVALLQTFIVLAKLAECGNFALPLPGATGFMLLDGWAFNRTVRAKHAAMSFLWFEQGSATLTFIEELAGMNRHGFCFGMTAVRASDYRVKNYRIHFFSSLMEDGYPAALVASVNLSGVAVASSNCTVAVLLV